jgi:hypothetical protein
MSREHNAVRRKAFADWLMEVSALVMVFPALDQLLRKDPTDWPLTIGAFVMALISMGGGLYLIRGDK